MKIRTICFAMLASLLITALPASAVLSPQILEAVGTLEEVETVKEGTISVDYVTIAVNGELFSTKFAPQCSFYDPNGKQISRDLFVRSYLRRHVSLSLLEIPNGSMVVSCRAR